MNETFAPILVNGQPLVIEELVQCARCGGEENLREFSAGRLVCDLCWDWELAANGTSLCCLGYYACSAECG